MNNEQGDPALADWNPDPDHHHPAAVLPSLMPRYFQEWAGADGWSEWITPATPEHEGKTYRIACCDCSLVHFVEVRVVDERVQFRVRRHNRATAAMRAHDRRARNGNA